jgi:F420-0:gamma-glutamyl ligase
MIADSVIKAAEKENFSIQDRDIIGVTEAVLARTQGNYATCEQIAADIRSKFGGKDLGIVFPILSRNRFLLLLKAIAMSCEKLYVQLSYPADEVGNSLITLDDLDETQVDPYTDSFTEVEFRKLFKNTAHIFTGVDYIEVYKNIGKHVEIIFSNNPSYILNYTKNVLNCDIHSRKRTQKILRKAGAEKVYRLDEILTSSVQGSGYNEEYGLLGSNNATGDSVKLFPRDAQIFVEQLQKRMSDLTGKHMEVMVYGDGCFKDPVGGIWEFADPVVSPGFTSGLLGTPHELKMKYFADNEFASLSGEDLISAMKERIKAKENDNTESMSSLGTTPRRITDLLGSLCDLTSGSGDRGTPVVLIQGYFNDFAS